MYKGKFSNNQSGRSTSELLQERASQRQAPQGAPAGKMPNPAFGRGPVPPQNARPDSFQNPQPADSQNISHDPIPGAGAAPSQNASPLPSQGARPMPPQGARPVPPQGARPVPPQGARPVPPQGARPVPPQGARPVPPQGARPVPPQGARPVPPQNARPVPPQGARPVHPQSVKPAGSQTAKAVSPATSKKIEAAPQKGLSKFYLCYFGFIFLFCLVTCIGLFWLKGWLTDYEAAQPYKMAEAVFQSYFAHPNWGALYDNSVTKGTDLEGKDAYVAHMVEKVGSSQLTYQETSTGLSGDKKYYVKLGDEKIASFILEGNSKNITDATWQLGDIELIFKYDNSYKIQIQEGHTAYVNNMALDDSYTIMKASSLAKDYLPVGTTGIRMWTQQIDNLMGKPAVKVVNEKGEEMPVIYDQETMTFTEQTQANSITEDQRTAAIGAAEAYGKYMISQANRGELAKYFDASSDIYNTIRTSEKIVQQSFFKSFDFGEETVSDFVMYSDDLFSVHVHVVMNVTRKDDTVKPYDIDTNLFFSKQTTGKWLAYDMTNEPVGQPVGQVRLTFMNGDEKLASGFYDIDAAELDTPLIAVPKGKVFSGWTRETVGEGGQKVLEVMFTPDETGHVVLPANNTLEPMVLTALFENAPAEGGAE